VTVSIKHFVAAWNLLNGPGWWEAAGTLLGAVAKVAPINRRNLRATRFVLRAK
jgi:hypothetical protein